MVTINSTLEDIMQLDYTSREMLLEILQKRQIEARRDDIAKTAKQSLKEYHSGKTHPTTADEAVNKLNSL
jgi:adenylate kinase family enzyme